MTRLREIAAPLRFGVLALSFLTVATLVMVPTQVRAADDDEEMELLDTKIFRGFMRGMGFRNGNEMGIEYRERSPLVVPPARTLPSPETASVTAKAQNWPTDADVKRRRDERAERRKPRKSIEEESTPERPNQLAGARGGAGTLRPGDKPSEPAGALSTWSELGSKSMFTLRGLWGQQEEYGAFEKEPVRESLIQPPTGYRTPSAAQPYGVGKERYTPTAINPMDTAAMRGQ